MERRERTMGETDCDRNSKQLVINSGGKSLVS